MAWFTKKEWKNRLVEFAGRRKLTNVASGTSEIFDVSRNEGVVSQEGDAFSAANMNDFEQRIFEGFTNAENSANALSQNMGGCTFSSDSSGAYVTYTANGSTVKKKLGSGEITVEEKTVSISQSYKESDYTQTFSKTATFSKTPKYVFIKSVSQGHSERIRDMDVKAPTFSGATATVQVSANVPAYVNFSMSVVLVAIFLSE